MTHSHVSLYFFCSHLSRECFPREENQRGPEVNSLLRQIIGPNRTTNALNQLNKVLR